MKEGYNYPNYPNHPQGKYLLIYIRKYLLSKLSNSKKPNYPKYIEKSKSKDNEKRYFRNIAENYKLDEQYNLCIIYKKNKNIDSHVDLKKIPFTKNILDFLYKIHSDDAHREINSLRDSVLNKNYFYKGITKDLNKVINNCSICKIKNKPIDLTKKEKYKLIVFNEPKQRYLADLAVIPKELVNNLENKNYDINNKYKYILTIVDHFSKYAESYLLENKTHNSILNALTNFFEFYGNPLELGTDNGKEFKNSLL